MHLAVKQHMLDIYSRAYKAVKTKITNHLGTPDRVSLGLPEPLFSKSLNLSEKLGCELNPNAVRKSLDVRARSTFLIQLALALLAIGVVWTLIGLISKATLSGTNADISLTVMIVLLIPAAMVVAGALLLTQQKSGDVDHIGDFENSGFKTIAMADVFQAFKSWGAEQAPPFGFKLSNDRFLALPDDIWNDPNLPVVLSGTEAQRRTVINADMSALTSLVISQDDWNRFWVSYNLETEETKPVALDTETEAAKTETIDIGTDGDKSHENRTKQSDNVLPIRKRMWGPKSKWSPRFRLICKDIKYLKRYDAQNVKLSAIDAANDICHNALLFLTLNFEDRDLIFNKAAPDPHRKQKAERLERELKAALRIEGKLYMTRYNQLIDKRWDFLETYIEQTGIISDKELEEEYPEVKAFTESEKSL